MVDHLKIVFCVLFCLKMETMCFEFKVEEHNKIMKRQLQDESNIDIPNGSLDVPETNTTGTIEVNTRKPLDDDEILYSDENDEIITPKAKKELKKSEAEFISAISEKLSELEALKNALDALSNDITETPKPQIQDALEVECPYYKQAPELNIEKVFDVWQIVFYKTTERLSCFKMYLKKTSNGYRNVLKSQFGDFNGTINWNHCLLELSTSSIRSKQTPEKHLLQGPYNNSIFENIIVTNHDNRVTLLEQSPDQWMVVNNLLLMRDCANGDVVVFCRVPMQCRAWDIEQALITFGEDRHNGTFACQALKEHRYKTLS